MKPLDCERRLRSDRGKPRPVHRADVEAARVEGSDETLDAVHAREYHPIVLPEPVESRIERCGGVGCGDLDRRDLDRVRARLGEQSAHAAGLGARTRDHDPPPEEGAALEPGDRLAQTNRGAEHDGNRRTEAPALDHLGDAGSRVDDGLLAWRATPADRRGRRVGGETRVDEPGQVRAHLRHAHKKHDRVARARDALPVDPRARARLMPGENRHARDPVAMSHRDPGEGRHGKRRRDPGNDLEAQAGRAQGFGLLGAPAEDEGVAPLKPHDGPTCAPESHQQLVDLFLFEQVAPRTVLAGEYALGGVRREAKQVGVGEEVVDDDVGTSQTFAPA